MNNNSFQTNLDNNYINLETYFDIAFENSAIDFFNGKTSRVSNEQDISVENLGFIPFEVDTQNNSEITNEEVLKDIDYKTPEFETKKSWLEKMQESKNPFAKAIAKGLVTFSSKNRKALPAPQVQEGKAKPRRFDAEQEGFDFSDGDLFPSKFIAIRNTIRKIIVKDNNSKIVSKPESTIKPITSNNFDKRVKVSKEELNKVKTQQTVIPQKVDSTKSVSSVKQTDDDYTL